MNKVFLILKLVSIVFLLVSCSNKSHKEEIISQKETEFSNNKQNFHIIPLYEEVLNYTKEMKEAKSQDNKQVYVDNVIKPFQDIVSEEEIQLGDGYFSYFSPTEQVETLEENTIKLLENQELINSLIKEALLKSSQAIGGTDKTIFIMPISPEDAFPVQYMEGVSGVAFDEKAVLINIDPSFSEEELKYVVAHEYHHTVRRENKELRQTLLDSFITEGGADVFARSIYPDKTPPWIQEPLSKESEAIILEGLKKNLHTMDSDIYNDFRIGNRVKEIPLWATYRMGYLIVESYVANNPEQSVDEWTKLSAEEVLKGSDYSFIE